MCTHMYTNMRVCTVYTDGRVQTCMFVYACVYRPRVCVWCPWASLLAQMIQNPPAVRETQV